VHLYEWGDRRGRPLLYWDGLGGTGLHANEIGPILARDYGFHVLAPDPPGQGRSPALPLDDYLPSRLATLAAEVGCAFAARFPERTAALVLVDGGHWDFADLPGADPSAPPPDERYASCDTYFAEQAADLGRWTPELEAAHRATMRKSNGATFRSSRSAASRPRCTTSSRTRRTSWRG
jgi:pimeloyl-ACP methyl ester carboxylesterase